MSKIEKELVCVCGAAVILYEAYRCTSCGTIHASLEALPNSGRTRDRQHEPGGFPNKPKAFR